MQLYSGEDSLVDSFPHTLEKMEGARRYTSAFRAPLQELSPAQVHALRACSLLVIPPPKEGGPPPGGFPKHLSDLNLSSWASLVQDDASGLMAPLPTLGSEVSLAAVALLDLLEKATGWVYYCFCYHLGSRCTCMGAFPPSWSKVVGESLGHEATASSGGLTIPGTPTTGYLLPPPGLPPIDYSKWRLPPPGAPASGGATAPPQLPGVRRSARLWGTAKRIVGAPRPGRLAQRMPVPPPTMPCVPQTAPVRQPCPVGPATPYQQAVQPPKRPAGRGVIADTLAGKTTLWVAQRRTAGGLQREGGDTAATPLVTQEVYQRWRVRSCSVRRVVGGASHHHLLHQCRREPSLNGEAGKCPPSRTLLGWWQTITVVGGEKTLNTF